MAKNTWLWIGGGVIAYLFLTKNSGTVNPLQNLLPAVVPAVPTTYGIGVQRPAPYAESVQNYAAIVVANPNQANPYYQLTAAEQQQYVANYLDIRQGVATWPGGLSPANIQKHWTLYGPSQQRIFLPLQPPSGAPYVAPPSNSNSSGMGFINTVSTIVSVGGEVAKIAMMAGPEPFEPLLNDAEVDLLVTSSAVIKKILPYYLEVAPNLVASIDNNIDGLLSRYAE
jgi:hypothetical protein